MFNFLFNKKSKNTVNKRKTNKSKTKKNLFRFRNDGPNAFNVPYENLPSKGGLVKARNFERELEVMWLEDGLNSRAIKSHSQEELDDDAGSVLQVVQESNERKVSGFWSRWKSLRRKKDTPAKNTKTTAQVGKYNSSKYNSNIKSSKLASKTFLPRIDNSPGTLTTKPSLALAKESITLNYKTDGKLSVAKDAVESEVAPTNILTKNTVCAATSFGFIVYHLISPFWNKLNVYHNQANKQFKMLKLMRNGLPRKFSTEFDYTSEFEKLREAVEGVIGN